MFGLRELCLRSRDLNKWDHLMMPEIEMCYNKGMFFFERMFSLTVDGPIRILQNL